MASAEILESSSSSSSCHGWLSPRISFSRDFQEQQPLSPLHYSHSLLQVEDDSCDFEFRPGVGCALRRMHSADELFFDGKLVPLPLSSPPPPATTHLQDEYHRDDKHTCPKAPKCGGGGGGGWKDFLRFNKSHNLDKLKTSKSFKFFRNSKTDSSSSSSSSSINLPLLDSETEPVSSSSSRLSLSSSSSSGPDHEDPPPPRLSLDSEKSTLPRVKLTKQLKTKLKTTTTTTTTTTSSSKLSSSSRAGRSTVRRASTSTSGGSSRGASMDSPRMNSSGKIVFHSLERSSSGPSSFNGGPRIKARGMERSYSANVRIKPVLNVPVSKSGSVFGFGQFFSSSSSQKRDGNGVTRNQSIKRNGSGTKKVTNLKV